MKWIFLFIVLIPLVFAVTTDQEVNINDFDRISFSCSKDGGSCPTDTDCNVTVLYPNSSIWLNKVTTSRINDTFFYETASPTVTGYFTVFGVCCDSEECGDSQYILNIYNTPVSNWRLTDCPQDYQSILILIFTFLGLVTLLLIGIKLTMGVLVFPTALGLVFFSAYIWGCSWIIGLPCFVFGIILLFVLITLFNNYIYPIKMKSEKIPIHTHI